MVRTPPEFAEQAQHYVCARITDMREVDLDFVRFDFDLTMAVVLMHPDGTVYHRYGARAADDATAWMSVPHLVTLLRDTLDDHRAYERAPAPPAQRAPRRAIDLPPLRRQLDEGRQLDCVHCHTVHDTEHRHAVEQGTWRDEQKWLYPDPARIGLELDPGDQRRVVAVAADSAAARTGLAPGDEVLACGVQANVRTIADLSWALHQVPFAGGPLAITVRRDGATAERTLELAPGWKVCAPRDYAWRPFQWNLSPAPGFGGPPLDAAAKAKLGIDPAVFAFRVQYLVDWGPRATRGRAAHAAGIRKGDVVLSFAGRSDFGSTNELHAWVRLGLQVGQEVEVELLRRGARHTVRYALPE